MNENHEHKEVLQEWSCCIDSISKHKLYLLMRSHDENGMLVEEEGEFPAKLLQHLDPKLGQYVTVRVLSSGVVEIENTQNSFPEKQSSSPNIREMMDFLRS